MKHTVLLLSLTCLLCQPLVVADLPFIGAAAVQARDDWKQTFNEVCGKTNNAMAYSAEELRKLIEECDALQTMVDDLQEPEKTIFRKRLSRCRGVYLYVLEAKENK